MSQAASGTLRRARQQGEAYQSCSVKNTLVWQSASRACCCRNARSRSTWSRSAAALLPPAPGDAACIAGGQQHAGALRMSDGANFDAPFLCRSAKQVERRHTVTPCRDGSTSVSACSLPMATPVEPDAVARRVLADSQSGAGAHAILGLPPTASASDVRSRYKQARPPARHVLCPRRRALTRLPAPLRPPSWPRCSTQTRPAARWRKTRLKARAGGRVRRAASTPSFTCRG